MYWWLRCNLRLKPIYAALIIFTVVLSVLAVGCDRTGTKSNTTANATIPDASWFPSKFSEIDVTHVGSGPTFVSFSGPAGLPDGTILLSALYEDGKLFPGWPTNQPIIVENSTWEVKVTLGIKGSPPTLRSGPSYLFIVWRKDNPESLAGQSFDLIGPPPAAP